MAYPRIAGLAAIGFVVLNVTLNLTLISASPPNSGASVAEVIEYFSTSKDQVGVSTAVIPTAWAMLLLFGSGVVSVLWRAERDRGEAWSLVGLAGLTLLWITATFAFLTIDDDSPISLFGLIGWLTWLVWLVAFGVTLIRLPVPSPAAPSGPGSTQPAQVRSTGVADGV